MVAAVERQKQGASWMLTSALLFSLHLAVLKQASLALHPFLLIFLRNAMAALGLWGLFAHRGLSPIANVPLFLVRSILGWAASTALYYGNALAPLAAVSLVFLARIFPLTMLAALLLGERVSGARWLGIMVGFWGVAVVIAPSPDGFQSVGLLAALAAGLLSAGSQVAVKVLTGRNTPLAVAAVSQIIAAVLSCPLALAVWRMPTLGETLLVGCAALFMALSSLAAARALSLAPVSILSPLDDFGIVISAVLGFAFFGEIPEWHVVVGALVVMGAADFVVRKT